MTPFQLFELWAKRASVAQRTGTAVAIALVVALLGWLMTPSTSPTDELSAGAGSFTPAQAQDTTGQGTLPTAAAGTPAQVGGAPSTTTTTTTGSSSARGAVGAPGSGGVGSGTATSSGSPVTAQGGAVATPRACPATADTGVTDTQISIAITILDAGNVQGVDVNEAAGLPSTEDQKKYWDTNLKHLNALGGTACRKMVPRYWNANPLDNNGSQQVCLKIADSKPFLVIDVGTLSATNTSDCIPQNKIPMITMKLSREQMSKYAPFYLSPTGAMDESYHDAARAMSQLGVFSAAKGYKKFGLVHTSCHPSLVESYKKELAAVGVTGLSTFDMGCPTLAVGNDNSREVTQAVLQFKSEGVTHVGNVEFGTQLPKFTKEAARQSFTPRYLILGEYQVPAFDPAGPSASGANGLDTANFDGAIAVIGGRFGEQATPGYKLDPKSAACQDRYVKAKIAEPRLYKMKASFGAVVCGLSDFGAMLIDAAPTLKKNALMANIRSLGVVDFSFPLGKQDFGLEPANTPWARLYWRAIYYKAELKGFQVTNPTFQKPFL